MAYKDPKGCLHGEIHTNVATGTITCRICGTSATLPRIPLNKNHRHQRQLFAGNGQVYWWCNDRQCGWTAPYVSPLPDG